LAARVKVIDLAKELGVTSKDLIVALEGMGHKGVRAMTPVPADTANELRVKLGRGRDLPIESKPKRPTKPKEVPAEAEVLGEPAATRTAEAKDPAGSVSTRLKGFDAGFRSRGLITTASAAAARRSRRLCAKVRFGNCAKQPCCARR